MRKRRIGTAKFFTLLLLLYHTSANDEELKLFMNNEEELKKRVYVFPQSALKINGKKINYFNYINSLENDDCNGALLRIFPKINLDKIYKIIDETPKIPSIRSLFYKKMIKMRYEMILESSYDKCLENNKKQ